MGRIQWIAAWVIVACLLYIAWNVAAEAPHRPAPVTVVTTVVTGEDER